MFCKKMWQTLQEISCDYHYTSELNVTHNNRFKSLS